MEQHTNSHDSSVHNHDDDTGTDGHDGACDNDTFFLPTLQAVAHHFPECGNMLALVKPWLQKQY
jgi:hypothetical protein